MASDIGPKISGPTENPNKKIVMVNWDIWFDVDKSDEMSGIAGNDASMANGANTVIAAMVGMKNLGKIF